jgi:CHAD domain-containing protein
MIGITADKWVEVVSASDPVVEVATRTLRGRLGAVIELLPLAADSPDLENVHQLRVWSRRASASLTLYKDMLPGRHFRWLKKRLRKIRRAANDARDCDVLIHRLQSRPPTSGTERWLRMVQSERQKAQKKIEKVRERLCSDAIFSMRMEKALKVIHYPGRENGQGPPRFDDWARERLAPFLDAFFNTAPIDQSDESGLHQFRIRGKRLRYVMEALQGAFSEEFRTLLYPIIQELQDRLGEINDLAMARARLQEKFRKARQPNKADMWRRLLLEEDAQARKARENFWQWCTPAMLLDLKQRFAAQVSGSMLGQETKSLRFDLERTAAKPA